MPVRRKSREKRPLRRLFFLITLLVFVLGGAYLVWLSPFFHIQAVEISGEELLANFDPEEIKGKNILFWEYSFEGLSESHRVAYVDVHKDYFERKVIIKLKPRSKHIVWCIGDEEPCYWVDAEGFIFSEAPTFEGALGFIMVQDVSGREFSLGDRVLEEELFGNLLLAIGFLEEINVGQYDLIVEDLKFKEAIAKLQRGPDIYFSLTLDPNFGKGVVKSLRKSGEWNIINYLDLRIGNRAYYSN